MGNHHLSKETSKVSDLDGFHIMPIPSIKLKRERYSCFDSMFFNDSIYCCFGNGDGIHILEFEEFGLCRSKTKRIKGLGHDLFSCRFVKIPGHPHPYVVSGSWQYLSCVDVVTLKEKHSTESFDDFVYDIFQFRERKDHVCSVSRGHAYVWKIEQLGAIRKLAKIRANPDDRGMYLLRGYQSKLHPDSLMITGNGFRLFDWEKNELLCMANRRLNNANDESSINSIVRNSREYYIILESSRRAESKISNITFLEANLSNKTFNRVKVLKMEKGIVFTYYRYHRRDFELLDHRYLVFTIKEKSFAMLDLNNSKYVINTDEDVVNDPIEIKRKELEIFDSEHHPSYFRRVEDQNNKGRYFLIFSSDKITVSQSGHQFVVGICERFSSGLSELEKKDMMERIDFLSSELIFVKEKDNVGEFVNDVFCVVIETNMYCSLRIPKSLLLE